LNTHLFDFERASLFSEWLSGEEHTPETEEYGISSFVFKARRPFHPQRLMQTLESGVFDAVIRSKGFVWLATRHHLVCVWSQAGDAVSFDYGGQWWATADASELPADPQLRAQIMQHFQEPFGDRRQELVIIGVDLPREALTAALDACLLTDAEMALGTRAWRKLQDPFEKWVFASPAEA
jgi:G3E family GTPase